MGGAPELRLSGVHGSQFSEPRGTVARLGVLCVPFWGGHVAFLISPKASLIGKK